MKSFGIFAIGSWCLLMAGTGPVFAAGHAHTETGHFPPGTTVASADYAGTEPPLWGNLGSLTYPITTSQPAAQRYFDQGLRLTYAFNHLEAQRAFRWAQKLDPECALCFWGEALVLGPNINAPMEASAAEPAWAAATRAKALAGRASQREQALIAALTKRYAKHPKAGRRDLDTAYAAAMGGVAARYPDDDDIAVLYAESLMDLSPWDYWADGGRRPKGRTEEILKVLERVLARNPGHPGAIHYYIHMVEASDRPERAEPYAGRLAGLMPGAGHLVHMPGHLYYRLGRYLDALEANRAAIAVDEAYLKETGATGIYAQAYYPHNVHFLMVSAQMAGDGKTALDAAGKLDRVVTAEAIRKVPWTQPIKAAPYFAYAQFGDPEVIRGLADPGSEFPYVQALWHYARGVGAAARKAGQEARAERNALKALIRTADFSGLISGGIPVPEILEIAEQVLAGRIAQSEGDLARAITAFDAAAAVQEKLSYMEPPYWYYPVRRTLGALKFLAGDSKGAEQALEAALVQAPNDAWALQGLAEVYRKLGKEAAAAAIGERLAKARAGAAVEMGRL